ncbi:hypothetical protein Hdeb2414_s0003g00084351 [Helianthus debilis subsp. tardiflorus]
MKSSKDEALEHAGSILSALSEKLYVIKGVCGAGFHIASAAEAMTLVWSSIGIGFKNLLYRQKMVKEHLVHFTVSTSLISSTTLVDRVDSERTS